MKIPTKTAFLCSTSAVASSTSYSWSFTCHSFFQKLAPHSTLLFHIVQVFFLLCADCSPIFDNHSIYSPTISSFRRLHWIFGSRHLTFVHLQLIVQSCWNHFLEYIQRSDKFLYQRDPTPDRASTEQCW